MSPTMSNAVQTMLSMSGSEETQPSLATTSLFERLTTHNNSAPDAGGSAAASAQVSAFNLADAAMGGLGAMPRRN